MSTFRDRDDAARQLAARLDDLKGRNPLILAIPRGAVPMGRMLAQALDGELDVVLVRKVGAPHDPELALGAVDETGTLSVAAHARGMADDRWLEAEAERQRHVLAKRRARLGRPPVDPRGRVVVVIDDGVATGATMAAALGSLRDRGARELIAAVPVATPRAVHRLARLADRVECLVEDPSLLSIGMYYLDFRQVSDDEVVEALQPLQGAR